VSTRGPELEPLRTPLRAAARGTNSSSLARSNLMQTTNRAGRMTGFSYGIVGRFPVAL
jgi:hypothetical protein